MKLFERLLKQRKNITTIKYGARVPPNKKVEKIVERVKKEIKPNRRKWW